jgi:hypothetical protein
MLVRQMLEKPEKEKKKGIPILNQSWVQGQISLDKHVTVFSEMLSQNLHLRSTNIQSGKESPQSCTFPVLYKCLQLNEY